MGDTFAQFRRIEGVEKLAREGKLQDLPGFGEKSEQNILKGHGVRQTLVWSLQTQCRGRRSREVFCLHHECRTVRNPRPLWNPVTPAGSLRRGRETIGDIDLLVTMRPGHDKQKDVDAVAEHIL